MVFNVAFVKMYDKWLNKAANIHLENVFGSKQVCRLKQTCTPTGEARKYLTTVTVFGSKEVCRLKKTCTPTGAARKYLTTVTDVCLLNYAVSLDEARDGTQKNTQGVCLVNYQLTVSRCNC